VPTEHEGDAIYAPGYSEEERQRLIEQAGFFGGFTERLLVDAGIGPGMRVLDVGCGVGDVSLLVASLVRPEGAVLGVDSNPLALGHARERVSAMGLTNVDFVEGNIRDLAFDEPFDAAVGRLVLMYLADPAATLRRIAALLRPGGIIAFQELTLTESGLTYPEAPLLQRTGTLINETFRRAGMEMEMGLKLYPAFIAAGLPAPAMRAERPIGGGPDFPGYRWMAQITRSILPLMEQFGVANAENIDIETLVERLREEVVGSGGVVAMPTLMGAWARKPTE
jgi:SAM-dependent methyltransferase